MKNVVDGNLMTKILSKARSIWAQVFSKRLHFWYE